MIDVLDIATSASPEEVLTLTLSHVERFERATEVKMVDQLRSTGRRGYSAVIALEPTLAALNRGRIAKLVYSDGLRSAGSECTKCEALFSDAVNSCKVCGAAALSRVNVVERAIERLLRQNAAIDAVKGEASDSLNGAGGIGAFLKAATRPKTASTGRLRRHRPP